MHANPGHTDSTSSSPKTSAARPAAQPFLEGKGYAMRKQYKGHDIYVSGAKTAGAADKKMRVKLQAIDKNERPAGLGADRTTLAQALQDYALARLPSMKGAVQEARRINHYLRGAGLQTLVASACADEQTPDVLDKKENKRQGDYYKITLEAHSLERNIANGLAAHRQAQLNANAKTEKFRAVLAGTALSKISRDLMQRYMDTMRSDGNAPATMALERSMFRVLFNYAFRTWKWTELFDNPATGLKMPAVENVRKRVMTLDEQSLLDEALTTCRSKLVAPLLTLLRETTMRSSEPLQHATWADVDWERKVLALPDSKSGCRDVPLSPVALQVLRDLGPGEPNETIIKITYESLRAAWTRACERACIKNLKIQDNRRTAATRMALKTGNAFLVQALTGHKTWSMVERYVNVGADDVVKVMHAPEPSAAPVPLPAEVGAPASVQDAQTVPVSRVWWSSHFGHINRMLSCRFTLKGVG